MRECQGRNNLCLKPSDKLCKSERRGVARKHGEVQSGECGREGALAALKLSPRIYEPNAPTRTHSVASPLSYLPSSTDHSSSSFLVSGFAPSLFLPSAGSTLSPSSFLLPSATILGEEDPLIESSPNVSVSIGRTAYIRCKITNLGHKSVRAASPFSLQAPKYHGILVYGVRTNLISL